MGYFSTGTEGVAYREEFCVKCVHWSDTCGCPCWDAHWRWNGYEHDKPDSILHKMIPRDKEGRNRECVFFVKGANDHVAAADHVISLQEMALNEPDVGPLCDAARDALTVYRGEYPT